MLCWLDTGWGCGGVFIDGEGTIVGGAPIFRKLFGRNIHVLPYRWVRVDAP